MGWYFRKDEGHYPCSVCGGPVEQRPGEPSYSWKSRACCSPECVHEAYVRRAIKGAEGAAIEKAEMSPIIGEWPENMRFEDAETNDGVVTRVPRPDALTSYCGNAAEMCAR